MKETFELAKRHFVAGVDDLKAGRLEAAEAHFETALALIPGRVSVLVNLAATRTRLGRPADALPLVEQALAAAPDDADAWLQRALALGALRRHDEALAAYERVIALAPGVAQAWFGHGQTLQHLDRHRDALKSYDAALAIDPALAQAWTNRGNILKDLGRLDDAAAAFREAIAHGGDEALNTYYLAAVNRAAVPAMPPPEYVERLFDDYADAFESHLVGALHYRGHEELMRRVRDAAGARFGAALDLGCGTGLCGPLLKEIAGRVDGVDVSAAMLDKARALEVYDRLEHVELVEHLARTERRYDLVLAADVFIYVGALEAVFAGVRRVLEPAGVFAFTVEHAADGDDYTLRRSLRYAHSKPYLERLAAANGFGVLTLHASPIREDQRKAVEGIYAVLRTA
jgi:predicted TPR repeat methyltransferase